MVFGLTMRKSDFSFDQADEKEKIIVTFPFECCSVGKIKVLNQNKIQMEVFLSRITKKGFHAVKYLSKKFVTLFA